MFEVNSSSEMEMVEDSSSIKAPTKTKKPKSKAQPKAKLEYKSRMKPKGFPELLDVANSWIPLNSSAPRVLLVGELQAMLEDRQFTCISACIPALIVDGTYPVEMMHYDKEKGPDEFITRMLWMHEVFKSSIGYLIGIPDDETADKVEEACRSLLPIDEDCMIMLL